MAALSPILKVDRLTTRLQLGRAIWTVVDNLSFNLYSGQTLALVGESGCGKSLTALSLMRILPSPPALPPEGQVLYQGRNLLAISEREMRKLRGAKIAMVFQNPQAALNPVYSIGSQLVEAAQLHLNVFGEEAFERALKVLEEVGIPSASERFNSYPHELSGGMKQRVMIAMALICQPDILIADEPTTALDSTIQAQVLALMRQLQEKRGMAILLITHDMGVVAEMADEVIVMYAAQAVEKGLVHDLFEHPAHPYTIGLFNARPSQQKKGQKLNAIAGQVPSFRDIPNGCRFGPRCPYAMTKCSEGQIAEYSISRSSTTQVSHQVKCLLHDKTDESYLRMEL